MLSYQFLKTPAYNQIDELILLYQEASWWSAGVDNRYLINGIVTRSHCFCVAMADSKIIGMGRAISDGVSDAYIQDVMVSKPFRHQGIATQIVILLIEKLEADGIGWIGLIAEKGSADFYHQLGFTSMANSTPMLRLRKL
jgi:spermidine synthase